VTSRAAGGTDGFARDVVRILGDGAPFEVDPLGIRCYRERASASQLRQLEELLLACGPVRILDFRIEARDLAENIVSAESRDPAAYEGVPKGGARVFRIDHHFDLEALEGESTTPLVLRWVRAQRERGRTDLVGEFAAARYLADHADPDIFFANHVAREAARDGVVDSPLADWLAAAAVRNDYIRLPRGEEEPHASRLYYAGIGLEEAILRGDLRFADALRDVAPAFGAWLAGSADAGLAERLDRLEGASREREAEVLRDIESWRREGRLTFHEGGRIAFLDAPRKIDNADLFLYFALRPDPPEVQVLSYRRANRPWLPEGEIRTYKIRARGGVNLNPVFERLRARWPEAGFGGRSAAGGSRTPVAGISRDALIGAIAGV